MVLPPHIPDLKKPESAHDILECCVKRHYKNAVFKLKEYLAAPKRFMTQRRVLKLYKAFFRATKMISNEKSRKEVQDWIREDFKSKKDEKNDDTINAQINLGEKSLNELIRTIKNTQPDSVAAEKGNAEGA